MKITVTQEDLNVGRPNHCWYCPIARAANRALGITPTTEFSTGCEVTPWHIVVLRDGKITVKYRLSDYARQMVRNIDGNIPVGPFEFELGEPV